MNEEKIIGKLLEHDVRFDKIIEKLLNHEDRLQYIEENMATKQDIRGIYDTLDVIVKMLKKHEEESVFMAFRVQENTKDIKQNVKDILGIKSAVGLA